MKAKTVAENPRLTLRNWFAGKALSGFLAAHAGCDEEGGFTLPAPEVAADWCFRFADAMVKESKQ